MTDTPTAQTTLLHTQLRDDARKDAIARIEDLMIPGARALAGTRTATSDYWIKRTHELDSVAPFAPYQVCLIWRDSGLSNSSKPRAPYDSDRYQSYSTQVVVDEAIGPEQLTELARLAVIYTAEIVRECEATTTAQCTALDAETEALRRIAVQ